MNVSDRAKTLIATMPGLPGTIWCIRLYWHDGDVENYRSSDGATVWTKGRPRGWSAEALPYHPALEEEFRFISVSDVKVWLDTTLEHQLSEATIDERDGELYVAATPGQTKG